MSKSVGYLWAAIDIASYFHETGGFSLTQNNIAGVWQIIDIAQRRGPYIRAYLPGVLSVLSD